MLVIPAINETDFEGVKKHADITGDIFKSLNVETSDRWIHIDVADGKFTKAVLWNSPKELRDVRREMPDVKIETHLMVERSEKVIDEWLAAGADRIIAHLESLSPDYVSSRIPHPASNIVLALNPDTSVEKLFNAMTHTLNAKRFLLLAVNPGWAGQKFNPIVLDKIKAIKAQISDAIIEVDGGINLETAKLCREAGADIVVAASYIFGSEDPEEAYKELSNI